MDKARFLARLRQYIDETNGITTANLAVKASLANSTIRRWFEGAVAPTVTSAEKALGVIGVSYQ